MSRPLIVGFGFEAESGKDEVCRHLAKLYKGSKVLHTAFAQRLRKETHEQMYQLMADHSLTPREALELMCKEAGVPYDPFAGADNLYPHGKQRAYLQWYGTAFRRLQCPTYWLDKIQETIEASDADLVLISDLRFLNEVDWIKQQGGYTVRVKRPQKRTLAAGASKHVSEQELANYEFDYTIENDGTLKELHSKAATVYRQILQYKLFPGG